MNQITEAFCWVIFRWRCPWWHNANIVEVLARTRKSSTEINALHAAYTCFMTNKYFDDCGWFILAWLKVYSWLGQPRFLKTAENMMTYMNKGWDPQAGGMFWTTAYNHKNAITNSLYILANAKLYGYTLKQPYLDRALAAWEWFTQSGMLQVSYVQDSAVDKRYWTYNYGVLIGALLELSKYRPELKSIPLSLAKEAIQQFSVDGILTEHGESIEWTGDSVMFKGIFMRYLGDLNNQINDTDLTQFIAFNAAAVSAIIAKFGTIGPSWHMSDYCEPPKFNVVALASAMDCMLANKIKF